MRPGDLSKMYTAAAKPRVQPKAASPKITCACKGTCNNAFNTTIKTRQFGSDPDFYGRELQPNACFVKCFAKKRSNNRDHIDIEYLYQTYILKPK
jgi:hypothetical protein